jgi:hypothetical protein
VRCLCFALLFTFQRPLSFFFNTHAFTNWGYRWEHVAFMLLALLVLLVVLVVLVVFEPLVPLVLLEPLALLVLLVSISTTSTTSSTSTISITSTTSTTRIIRLQLCYHAASLRLRWECHSPNLLEQLSNLAQFLSNPLHVDLFQTSSQL